MIDYNRYILPSAEKDSVVPASASSGKARGGDRLPKPQKGENFLAFNMPWSWFSAAAGLKGKALAIGMVIWWLVTVKKQKGVSFSYKRAKCTGLSNESVRQAIKSLESAGLIEVERGPGRSPRISVLSAPNLAQCEDAEG